MKKKILFVIDSLQSGGAEKSLVSLLSLFDYTKYEVDLLMFSASGLYLPLLPKQVNILEVP
ncbi:glycosyltransferase, partial [Bacillus cereus]|nr:glycosyltransferase [Bacillus cereus]